MASEALDIKDDTLRPKTILLMANITRSQRDHLFGTHKEDPNLLEQSPQKGKPLEGSYGERSQLPESALNPNNIQFKSNVNP